MLGEEIEKARLRLALEAFREAVKGLQNSVFKTYDSDCDPYKDLEEPRKEIVAMCRGIARYLTTFREAAREAFNNYLAAALAILGLAPSRIVLGDPQFYVITEFENGIRVECFDDTPGTCAFDKDPLEDLKKVGASNKEVNELRLWLFRIITDAAKEAYEGRVGPGMSALAKVANLAGTRIHIQHRSGSNVNLIGNA